MVNTLTENISKMELLLKSVTLDAAEVEENVKQV
jgi:hypothetical protein